MRERKSLYDLDIIQNPKTFRYEREVMNKKYRELPNTEVFFEKYSKINLALKYGTHSDYSLNKESYEKIINRLKRNI